ncbi:type IV secretion system protein VirB9 [Pseudoduganella lurida]|uniref:Type IV secretion system protein VirB9 n=1 Tax=Pseudoduganella lurida TaxID=1036180 RepID=A0A562R1T6_9BURK|nr:P-type conjugative transfer protein TrbG [Pseudoduganella lurida]TWI62554.1 type IV secretion system protein VirB9 [Pseudoduganella lurida]
MKPAPLIQTVAALLATLSVCGIASAVPPEKSLADQYFNTKSPRLTQSEQDALSISQQWRGGGPGSRPVAGTDGTIRYLYGAQQPSIVCAVLQVCDVELQAGEQVNSIHLGDTARWLVEPAITGSGAAEVQHLIIKPMDVALETSLIVTTNRRTYHFRLRSHRTEFMARVAFTYADEAAAKWEALRQREAKVKEDRTIPQTGEYLGDLSFSYTIGGSASWKPVRVYNDGSKTVIQMARAMAQTEAPTLLVVRKDGGWFSDAETVLVNYRVQGDRYIVDTVFDKAILVAGVGDGQQRITITREK